MNDRKRAVWVPERVKERVRAVESELDAAGCTREQEAKRFLEGG